MPSQIFHSARDTDLRRLYDVRIVTVDGGPVRCAAGFTITPDYGPEELGRADSVVDSGIDAVRSPHIGPALDPRVRAAFDRIRVRTFTRRFRAEAEMSPGRWITYQRVEHARRILESTDLPIDRVAIAAGFGTATSLRQHLHAAIGVAPAAYRRTFSGLR